MSAGPTPRPLTICGLGPGADNSVTKQTLDRIEESDACFLRTGQHPNVHLLSGYSTFDFLYDRADTFEEVYRAIVEELAAATNKWERVTYVVPGSPLILERSVRYLLNDERFVVELLPALSFLDVIWARLGIDPVEEGVRLIDGHQFGEQARGSLGAMLVAHAHSNMVLSDIKLSLDAGPEQKAILVQAVGTKSEIVVEVEWPELDRTIEADHLTSVYIPQIRGEIEMYHPESHPNRSVFAKWSKRVFS